jgi:hypothetical protein
MIQTALLSEYQADEEKIEEVVGRVQLWAPSLIAFNMFLLLNPF